MAKTKLPADIEESVINVGIDTFGDIKTFIHWLEVPCIPLGNQVPLYLLKTKEGKEMIMNELGQIKHGIIV